MFYSVAAHCLGPPVMELEGVCELALQDMVSFVSNKVISNSPHFYSGVDVTMVVFSTEPNEDQSG